MPVSFRRLRIAGFKSFAEPASLEILPGLTGIVGPNGCGKSNIIEALRWVMGESSARTLRGGEMEDVIFAGAAGRPSRNIAEVTLCLEGTEDVAPSPFQGTAELEIVRCIERGSGSSYRVNGHDMRARDVQTLFADLASGSRASAMISQGRVGAIVAARPEDRRVVLEEAANITGLDARRHEAELKLRAAEANLSRAEDLRAQQESQRDDLNRQARQASRYRTVSVAVRAAEAELLSLRHARVEQARAWAAAALHDSSRAVEAATQAATVALADAAKAEAALPPLRDIETDARTVLERQRIAREQISGEEQRATAMLADARRRCEQIRQDLEHAIQLQRDAEAANGRLAAEEAELATADRDYAGHAAEAEAETLQAADALREAEADTDAATQAAAEANARAQAAAQLRAQAEHRASRLNDQIQALNHERAKLASEQVDPAVIAHASSAVAQAEAALATARRTVEQAERARAKAVTALAAARDAHSAADSARVRLAAEAEALAEVLAAKDADRWPSVIDSLTVADGLEAALGAVLGEDLISPANQEAARHWRELPPFDAATALPVPVTPLAAFVRGPAALARALSQVGLVETDHEGVAHQAGLRPGQSLVARSGAVWRWDGYTVRAGTPSPAAVRLQQRNRLTELRTRLRLAEQAASEAQAAQALAETAAKATAAAEQAARTARREGEQKLEQARSRLTAFLNQSAKAAARLAAADERRAGLTGESHEAAAILAQVRATATALPDAAELRRAADGARTVLAAARQRDTVARAGRDTLRREHAAGAARRRVITAERAGWAERGRDAVSRATDLAARHAEAEDAVRALKARPEEIAARRAIALEALEAAETTYRRAAEALSSALPHAAEAAHAARAAETALASRREGLVRAEGNLQQAILACAAVADHILERLGANPSLPEPPSDVTQDGENSARRRLERLAKEREEMGPVNLRAEQEAAAVEQRIAAIETERSELTTAIAKVRGSIGYLNRQGRERLNAVFGDVDRNFQQLFTRMFGGGKAHLALVGSDDPLEAGLEIFAQPPGKKLATLSLLSGGEQALTALSLIFAVFRCTPAPVCVLDEVDAPLDDANVERFCNLLDDMARDTGTRFLVVTHHPLTMARMDRLYGVTMQERGVSRLLSVDLVRAAGMLDPARAAAE